MKIKSTKAIVFLIIILICVLANMFFYKSEAYDFMGEIETTAGGTADGDIAEPVTSLAGTVITIVRVVCAGVAVIMLLVLGIKYMVSAPNDRATIMKHAWVYLVGAIIMFASSGILTIIAKFAANLKA